MLKQFFSKTFWIYFIVSTLVITVSTIAYIVYDKADLIFSHSTPSDLVVPYIQFSVLALLPSLIINAIAIATFFTFRKTTLKGAPNFFKLLCTGLLFIAPFSIAYYAYHSTIHPDIYKETVTYSYNIRMYSRTPQKIEGNTRENLNYNKTHDLESITDKVLTSSRLQFKLDSVTQEQDQRLKEARRLLALLPKERAEDAYAYYKLESWGIPFQYSSAETLEEYLEGDLYNLTSNLEEASYQVVSLKYEKLMRIVNVALIFLTYIVYAFLGYALRGKTLTKICGYIAIFIVITYSISYIYSWCGGTLKEIYHVGRSIR